MKNTEKMTLSRRGGSSLNWGVLKNITGGRKGGKKRGRGLRCEDWNEGVGLLLYIMEERREEGD